MESGHFAVHRVLMARESLDAWLHGIEHWIAAPPRRASFWRQKLDGVEGIIEVGFNQHSKTATAAYSIHSSPFDLLVHGRNMRGGGILVVQAGHAVRPFRSVIAFPEDSDTINLLTATIEKEASGFFLSLPNLHAVYNELVTSQPMYSSAFPQAVSHRQMFAAVVASLIGDDWRPHMKESFRTLKVESARSWLLAVKERLEQASS
jgi:hypothetical protein